MAVPDYKVQIPTENDQLISQLSGITELISSPIQMAVDICLNAVVES